VAHAGPPGGSTPFSWGSVRSLVYPGSMSFEGRAIAITGAASGIGRALALELGSRGADLALCDMDEDGLAETSKQAEALGRRVLKRRVDVADRQAVHGFAEAMAAELGRVDGIVNNAGVSVSQVLAEMSYEDLEWIFGVNFWGTVHGTKAFLPHLLARGDGWIVNISSILGIISSPTQSAYNATKFAVRGLSESLRQELSGTGVAVCCVHPGFIKTNIIRNSRFYVSADGHGDRDRSTREFEKFAQTTPEQAAQAIARGMERRSPRILVGLDAHVVELVSRVWPVGYPGVLNRLSMRPRPR
jgi:NADP-dependent 3-hydroxy acid dehydrogenase YdfG